MMRLFISLAILAASITGLVGCSNSNLGESPTAGEAETVTALVLDEGQKQVRVKIAGMTCPEGCPVAVRALLEGVPGVAEVGEVDFKNSVVDCAVEETQFDATKVAEAFTGTLFEGSAVQN